MNNQHTQGEWKVCHGANLIPSIGSAEFHKPIAHLCRMTNEERFCEEAEANARLIASAPELLDALIFISEGCNPNSSDGFSSLEAIKKIADFAINKAIKK